MIKGDSVNLRPVEKRDLALIARWRNDPRVLHSFFSPFLINPDTQEKWYESLINDPRRMVVMIDNLEGNPVGMVGFDNIDRVNQQAEIAFLLIEPEQWDPFLVWEGCSLLTQYGFQELNLRRLYAIVYADRFEKVWFEFSGYKKEVVLRQSAYMAGKFQDKVIWGVLRDDWYREMFGEENKAKRGTENFVRRSS